jgi:hypothetical protein
MFSAHARTKETTLVVLAAFAVIVVVAFFVRFVIAMLSELRLLTISKRTRFAKNIRFRPSGKISHFRFANRRDFASEIARRAR